MQKALLSLAVIAASGAYVVYQGHSAQQLTQDSAGAAASLPSSAGAAAGSAEPKQAMVAPSSPTPSALVVAPPSAPASAAVEDAAAEDEATLSSAPAVAPVAVVPAVAASAAPARAMPLPRPRPADASVAIENVAAQKVAQAASGLRDGTFQGVSANAYYGRVEVDAVIRSGQLVKVDILDYPSDRRTSRNINSRALPQLQQEAIQAQSANIDTVSGATLSSEAFIQSLDSALQRAQGAGNA